MKTSAGSLYRRQGFKRPGVNEGNGETGRNAGQRLLNGRISMGERRARATIDIWIARIGTAFGWFWFVLYALCTVVTIVDLPKAKDNTDYAMPFIFIGLAVAHFLLIRVSKRTRRLVSDFRYYAAVLAKNKSIAELSKTVKEPQEEVEKKLILMCRRGYFNGHADLANDCLKLHSEPCAARCPGCGATTKIFKNGDVCRYCGNPLELGTAVHETEPPE